MNNELMTPPEVTVTPRRFTVVLTEAQAAKLVARLKFNQHHAPDLTQPVWKELEKQLGYNVVDD